VNGLKGDEVNLEKPFRSPSSPGQPRLPRQGRGRRSAILAGPGPRRTSLNGFPASSCAATRAGPWRPHFPARNKRLREELPGPRCTTTNVGSPQPRTRSAVVMPVPSSRSRLPTINEPWADAFLPLPTTGTRRWPGPTHPNRLYIHMGTSAGYAHKRLESPLRQRDHIPNPPGAAGQDLDHLRLFDVKRSQEHDAGQRRPRRSFKRFKGLRRRRRRGAGKLPKLPRSSCRACSTRAAAPAKRPARLHRDAPPRPNT